MVAEFFSQPIYQGYKQLLLMRHIYISGSVYSYVISCTWWAFFKFYSMQVYADELVDDDYLFICSSLFPSISKVFLSKLICFNHRIYEDTMVLHKYGADGSPWEFNLRDVIRSCQLIEGL